MTRKEALREVNESNGYPFNDFPDMAKNNVSIFINKIYDSLEQHIAELESPKTCTTCLYFERSEHEFGHYEGNCLAFIVQNKDFQTVDDSFGCIEYEPKKDTE